MLGKIQALLGNRNVILVLALVGGLIFGGGARVGEPLVLPVLAVIMTVSCLGVTGKVISRLREFMTFVLGGVLLNFLVLGGFFLAASKLFLRDEELANGFVLMAAVPPGVAIVPFTHILGGNSTFSLLGTMGGYLGALVITPLIAVWFLGTGFADPFKILAIAVEQIVIPVIASWGLIKWGVARHVLPLKGFITNWGFFIVTYTIIGLNRQVFIHQPLSLLPVFALGLASTFIVGFMVEWVGRLCGFSKQTITSAVLLSTVKNYGLSGGLALTLFSERTAVPSAVATFFTIVYFIWLGLRHRAG
jgi:BASS family bile acid:Na+ symporter